MCIFLPPDSSLTAETEPNPTSSTHFDRSSRRIGCLKQSRGFVGTTVAGQTRDGGGRPCHDRAAFLYFHWRARTGGGGMSMKRRLFPLRSPHSCESAFWARVRATPIKSIPPDALDLSHGRVRQPFSRRARYQSPRQSDISPQYRRAHEFALHLQGAQGPAAARVVCFARRASNQTTRLRISGPLYVCR